MCFVWIWEQTAIIPTFCNISPTHNVSFPLTFHLLAHHNTTPHHTFTRRQVPFMWTYYNRRPHIQHNKSHQLINSNISLQIAQCISTEAMWRNIITTRPDPPTRPVASATLHNLRSKRALCTMPRTRCGPHSCQLEKHRLSFIGPEASLRVLKSVIAPQTGARWQCTSSLHNSAVHFNNILTFTTSSLRRSLWNFVYALVSLMRATYPTNLILRHLITQITNSTNHVRISILYNSFQSPLKGKKVKLPLFAPRRRKGGVVQLHSFLTSALYGGQ